MKVNISSNKPIECSENLADIIKTADYVLSQVGPDGVAVEGIGINLLDTIIGLFGKFKGALRDNLVSLVSNTQSSELRKYKDRHGVIISAISRTPYHKIMDVEVYAPTGMKMKYKDASAAVISLYKLLNIVKTFEFVQKTLETAYRDISRGNVSQSDAILLALKGLTDPAVIDKAAGEVGARVINLDTQDQKKRDQQINELITEAYRLAKSYADDIEKLIDAVSTGSEKFKFKDLFDSVGDYATTINLLLQEERQMTQAKDVLALSKELNGVVEQIISYVSNNEVSKEYIASLAQVVRLLAIYVQQYGFAVATQMTLEHNLILTSQELKKHI